MYKRQQDTRVLAPFSGTIMVAFPTGHAYGIKADNGKEVLIHIGMDTVELNGEGFHPHVKAGDVVKQGEDVYKRQIQQILNQGLQQLSDASANTLHSHACIFIGICLYHVIHSFCLRQINPAV